MGSRRRFVWGWLFVLVAAAVAMSPVMATAAATGIVLDGDFADWSGRDHVSDRRGDATRNPADMVDVFWAINDGDPNIYWMVERQGMGGQEEALAGGGADALYEAHVDSNNNGKFLDHVDRLVQVHYVPQNSKSVVSTSVRYADTRKIIGSAKNRDWGESISDGGKRVEFAASFADLGIVAGQPVRMFVTSSDATSAGIHIGDGVDTELTPIDRAPDSGDIQTSPVSAAGSVLLAFVVVTGAVATWYFKGRREWS